MRRYLKKLHKWLSIPAGIILTIVCLSGALLVFQDEIMELANPSHYFVKNVKDSPIPLDELIPIVNNQLENNTVLDVKISSDASRTYTMMLSEGFRVSVFVDQYTGKITGKYEFRESPFFTIMSIHRWLMDGSRTWGKYTVGISTLLFVFILISGFVVWFPRKRKKGHFKIQLRKGRKRLFYDLHSVLGVYGCLLLLICALTGLMWSFDWYRNSVFSIFGAEVPKEQGHGRQKGGKDKYKEKLSYVHWQNVFNTIKASNLGFEYIRVQDGTADVHLKSVAVSRVTDKYKFDKDSGNIISATLYKDQEKTTRIWGWVYSLHVGNYWGIYSKILTCIAALIGASLPLTGYYMYFVKRKKKSKNMRKARS